MNELQKYMLMLQGGYKPQAGAITSDQMQGFKNAGLLNKTVALENQIQDTNNLIGSLNIPKQPIAVPNTANEDLLKKQKKANMFMALGDLLQGKDATAGFTQRQAGFNAQKEKAERQAKQEQLMKDRQEYMKNNPELAGAIRLKELFDMQMPQQKDPTQSDIYKQAAARIKNIVLNEGINSTNLTEQERNFYKDNINKQGFMSFNEGLAQMMLGNTGGQNNSTKNYTVINKSYGSMSANEIINQAIKLNPGSTKEGVIKNLIANKIISE
jgi:hypothetical protein